METRCDTRCGWRRGMPEITIAGRRIGPGHAPFIIAECGINDGGDKERASALIEAARRADCDAVKWQTHVRAECGESQPWQSFATIEHASMYSAVRGPFIAFGF